MLELIKKDPYLKDYSDIILKRLNKSKILEKKLLFNTNSLQEFANGHLYFGLHKNKNGYTFREWAPNATEIFLIGEFSDWQERKEFKLKRINNGNWELKIKNGIIKDKQLYRLSIYWNNGCGDRLPAWSRRVVQDEKTLIFNAQVWDSEDDYNWKFDKNRIEVPNPIIYEAHIGMATEKQEVGTFNQFTKNILPRIKKAGYNVIQLMAIQQHPFYGSFGYHVSNFFSPSSRFGTPRELKNLIDTAHKMEIMVIMDVVHSHAVKNQVEGIANFDGTQYLYFHDGVRGEHSAWDSLCFDYSKEQVVHFLLSNLKYWLNEYHFDGFRFDGTTSMLYLDHGLERDFTDYSMYFNNSVDEDAVTYLILANKLVHQINAKAITIAEEMSGYPGVAFDIDGGGLGFDFRLAMGQPDYWIKTIKEKSDENWSVGNIFYQMTNRRKEEKVIAYTESHDQALVGDKTLIFRLIDKQMYFAMEKKSEDVLVNRGIAIVNMLKLITISTTNGGYLNFMGNEFGHPEWIDFPRLGNNWSYKFARRQWSLVDNPTLRYKQIDEFDKKMVELVKNTNLLKKDKIDQIVSNEEDQVLAYKRGKLLFVFNFNPTKSFAGYGLNCPLGKYKIVLNSDDEIFGGFGRVDYKIEYLTTNLDKNINQLKLYIPNRTALILEKES